MGTSNGIRGIQELRTFKSGKRASTDGSVVSNIYLSYLKLCNLKKQREILKRQKNIFQSRLNENKGSINATEKEMKNCLEKSRSFLPKEQNKKIAAKQKGKKNKNEPKKFGSMKFEY